jgi:lysophospholipase L1-like esterase
MVHQIISRLKVKNFLTNFILFISSVIIALILGECLLRSYYWFQHYQIKSLQPMGGLYEYDAVLGWKKKQNYHGRLFDSEFTCNYITNSRGIRGPEYSYKKNKNTFRILILGDSYSDGYTVEFNDLFSEVLSKKLNQPKNNFQYEIINAGVAGYSTDQEMLFFETEGYKYEPDITILMYYENDHHQNMMPFANEKKPYAVLENDSLFIKGVPVPEIKSNMKEWGYDEEIKLHSNPSLFLKMKVWMLFHFELYKLFAQTMRNNKYLYEMAIKLGIMTDRIKDNDVRKMEIPYFNTNVNPFVDYAWRLQEKILQRLKTDVNKYGDFLIFYIPQRMEIYEDEWLNFKEEYELDSTYNVHHILFCLKNICDKNSIVFIDTVNHFRTQADRLSVSNERLYFKNDVHWNENGHRMAAEALKNCINIPSKTK